MTWLMKAYNLRCFLACVHEIFCIPRRSGPGVRVITNCSKPVGYFVNNFVDQLCSTFSYNIVDCFTAIDIQYAYRAISIYSDNCLWQGIILDIDSSSAYLLD